jgi:hypothetical protein
VVALIDRLNNRPKTGRSLPIPDPAARPLSYLPWPENAETEAKLLHYPRRTSIERPNHSALTETRRREFPTAPVSEGLPTLAVKTLPSTASFNPGGAVPYRQTFQGSGRRLHSVLGQRVNGIQNSNPCGVRSAYVNDVAGTSVRLAEANLNEIYHVAGPVAMSSFDLKVMLKKAFHAACPGGCSWIREISVSKEASLGYFAVVCETQATIAWPVRSW